MAIAGLINESIQVAAQLGVLGLDPMEFLYTTDSFKRSVMQRLGELMVEEKRKLDNNLAVQIANNVGKIFK